MGENIGAVTKTKKPAAEENELIKDREDMDCLYENSKQEEEWNKQRKEWLFQSLFKR